MQTVLTGRAVRNAGEKGRFGHLEAKKRLKTRLKPAGSSYFHAFLGRAIHLCCQRVAA